MIRAEINDRQVLDALNRLSGALDDLTPAMQDIGDELVELVRGTFSDSTDPWGGSWRPLAPATLERRRKKGKDAKPLRDTGVLMNSITSNAGRDWVEVGSNDNFEKAATHQFGTRRVPARPFLPLMGGGADLPGDWQASVLDIIQDHIRRAMP